MDLLSIVLLVVFGFSSVLLVLIILLQDEQGEGLGGIFGGGSNNQIGNRKGNFLTKATSILGALFLVIAFGLAWINKQSETDLAVLDKNEGTESSETTYEWWKAEPKASVAPDAAASPVPQEAAVPATDLENPAASPAVPAPAASAPATSQ